MLSLCVSASVCGCVCADVCAWLLDSNIIPAFVCLLMCNLHLPKCFTSTETTRRQKFNKNRARETFHPTSVAAIHSHTRSIHSQFIHTFEHSYDLLVLYRVFTDCRLNRYAIAIDYMILFCLTAIIIP